MIQRPFMAPETERQVCDSWGRRQGVAAISAPETASAAKLWVDCQSLPTSSWNPGWLRSSRRVTAWDQLPEETHGPPVTISCGALRRLSSLDLEGARPPWLWRLPCGPATVSAPHTRQQHLQCPYLSTAQVSKWAQISGHFCFLVSGQRSDTEERLTTRGGQHEQRKEGRTAPEMQGTTDSNPAVKLRLCTLGATGDFKNTYKPEKGISETNLTPHCPQEIQRPSWIYWRISEEATRLEQEKEGTFISLPPYIITFSPPPINFFFIIIIFLFLLFFMNFILYYFLPPFFLFSPHTLLIWFFIFFTAYF